MIRVNATGCSLVDNLYGHVDFTTEAYGKLVSRTPGDGGLSIGGLVFSEAFTEFTGGDYDTVLMSLTNGVAPDSSNIGGPGIVPIIHAAQVRQSTDISYRFAGVVGRDENGRRFQKLLAKTGFPFDDYTESGLPTPSTDVLSDPDFNGGRGERTFINTIGAAGAYGPESLPGDFFDADFLLFGGTALVPPLHDSLDELCRRGRETGAFVMVTTVYDFRNEARFKGKPWPLVKNYGNIDLLVVDREEALRISGEAAPEAAMAWFLAKGSRAVVVTQGAGDVLLGVGHRCFVTPGRLKMPTCRYADEVVAGFTEKRDTTGCGDNFVGGMIDSLTHQMAAAGAAVMSGGKGGSPPLNLEEAIVRGIAAGSVALTCLGGVYYETKPGQKFEAMQPYFEAYRRELAEGDEAARDDSRRSPARCERPEIVIFGAGNIGRSFIAPVFTRGGYEAVFADVAPAVLAALETRDSYTLIEKSDAGDSRHEVGPVRAVDAWNTVAVARELEGAEICATCVGAAALPIVLKTIAGAVAGRERPLDIILAENLKGAADLARAAFEAAGIPAAEVNRRLGIVETSIGKMVPIMPAEVAAADPLLSWAETFNTLIVDRDGFVGPVPEIPDFMAVSPIAPWVARKLYIHNFGHAAAAYIGNRRLPEATYIWEVLEDSEVATGVREAMRISGEALRREYTGVFSTEDIEAHIADLISRFRNRALGDTVYRVGRDLVRKLKRRDRVVGALEMARKHGLDTKAPLEVFRAALEFRASGPTGAMDENDAAVIEAAHTGNAAGSAIFLRDIVGIDKAIEPELTKLLLKALEEARQ